jgi:hypothetical protein
VVGSFRRAQDPRGEGELGNEPALRGILLDLGLKRPALDRVRVETLVREQQGVRDDQRARLTYNGRPDASWYFLEVGKGSALRSLQTDFIWAIPSKAKSIKKPLKP